MAAIEIHPGLNSTPAPILSTANITKTRFWPRVTAMSESRRRPSVGSMIPCCGESPAPSTAAGIASRWKAPPRSSGRSRSIILRWRWITGAISASGSVFSVALRTSGGYSGGGYPKTYFVGGNTNRIGNISVDENVYQVENLYFSSVVTPLRDTIIMNWPAHGTPSPMSRCVFLSSIIFVMRYPLHVGLSQVSGALFLDAGAAWSDHDGFKGATADGGSRLVGIKSGFGFGARANLGFLVLRYDLAWRTDFRTVAPHTKHYFSLGADF